MAVAFLAVLTDSTFPNSDLWTWWQTYRPRNLNNSNPPVPDGSIQTANLLVPGDSTHSLYRRWIEVRGYRFDPAARSSQNNFQMWITKTHDRASPLLAKRAATKEKVPAVVLEVTHETRQVPKNADPSVNTEMANHKTTMLLVDVQVGSFLAYGETESNSHATSEEFLLTSASFAFRYDTINDGSLQQDWRGIT